MHYEHGSVAVWPDRRCGWPGRPIIANARTGAIWRVWPLRVQIVLRACACAACVIICHEAVEPIRCSVWNSRLVRCTIGRWKRIELHDFLCSLSEMDFRNWWGNFNFREQQHYPNIVGHRQQRYPSEENSACYNVAAHLPQVVMLFTWTSRGGLCTTSTAWLLQPSHAVESKRSASKCHFGAEFGWQQDIADCECWHQLLRRYTVLYVRCVTMVSLVEEAVLFFDNFLRTWGM